MTPAKPDPARADREGHRPDGRAPSENARRFPAPWTVSDTGTSWKVEDAAGFAMVWFCYEAPRESGTWPERLTRDEARRLALGFAKLPALLAGS